MDKPALTITRTYVETTTYHQPCPYCKKKPLINKTCGDPICQYKHHIVTCRRNRKTNRKNPKIKTKLI